MKCAKDSADRDGLLNELDTQMQTPYMHIYIYIYILHDQLTLRKVRIDMTFHA
jgi:hypothetical protein